MQMLDDCLNLGSKDNMTTLVVKFKAQTIGEGDGVMARRKQREEQLKRYEEASSQVDEGDAKDGSDEALGPHDES